MKRNFFKKTNFLRFFAIIFLFGIFFPGLLFATTPPTEAIKMRVDAVIAILKDPSYTPGDANMAEKQHNDLFYAVKDLLDFKTISALATGQNWKRFSEDEKTRFIDLFARLLANTYIEKLQDNFKNESVVYDGEDILSKDRSEVRTHIQLRDGKTTPVLYKLRLIGGEWRVYDAYIENVSLVQNYRTQFDDFLMKNEPSVLVNHLDTRVKELEKDRIERRRTGQPPPPLPADNAMDLNL